ncbi:neuropeptide S receptor-like [Ylistrum balloti]|uniref:neuropeptide S receptor-like n=1 Tax=Ylistrum balloti TaxID=509963 RepID=UPI002905A815|nr:neuropeptide S receptor-like [Ylistrum balloti]
MEEWDKNVVEIYCVHNASRTICHKNLSEIENVKEGDIEIWTPDVIQRVASIVVIMVLTLVGNTVIIIILTCSRYRKRNSRVNIFIINLAVGDLTVCVVTMTTEILFVAFGEWVLGAAACKILTYVQVVTLASTTFILTSMGFDRYMAICRPLKFRSSHTRARRMIIISWTLAFIFAVPQLLIFVQTVDEVLPNGEIQYGCRSQGYTAMWQRKIYFMFMTMYILIVPAILLSYCYVNVVIVVWRQGKLINGTNTCSLRKSIVNTSAIPRAKIKTVKMTFCIIISFIACWTPYFVTTLIRIYSNYTYKFSPSVMAFAETSTLLQSALNPLIYGFFNIQIKRGLMEVFCPSRINTRQSEEIYNNASDCLTVSGDFKCTNRGMLKLKEPNSSSSSGSFDRGRSSHGCIIAEANTNGFKLRVRFLSKEKLYVHDRVSYSRCSAKDNDNEHITCDSVM